MVSERSFEVLRAIVEDYVSTREPVGSKALIERHGFEVSSATIRNDMALLEDEGLIHAPHTSAGRIPTDSGYRLFVDRLNELKPLSNAERAAMETLLSDNADLDELLARSVKLLSQLTNQVALVQYPTLGGAKVRSVEIIPAGETKVLLILISDRGRIEQRVVELAVSSESPFVSQLRGTIDSKLRGRPLSEIKILTDGLELGFEPQIRETIKTLLQVLSQMVEANLHDKMVLAGTANLVRSELDFGNNLSPLLDAIEEQVVLLRLISEIETDSGNVTLRIGSENLSPSLNSASVVLSGYGGAGENVAKVGLIGPTRMNYSANIQAVRAIANYLSKSLEN